MKTQDTGFQPRRLFSVARILCAGLCLMTGAGAALGAGATAREQFSDGTNAYYAGDFARAEECFRAAASTAPAAGTLHNLGNAEWQNGHPGDAMLAWERAQWLNPFSRDTASNLRFARKTVQLDPPELAWYEICSTWLPVNWWAAMACVSFWLAVALVLLPGVLRWRRAGWHQAVASAGFALFLLTIPALAGVGTRSRIGILLAKDTPLRLTPTSEAQVLTRLPAGESGRYERERGNYVFIRTSTVAGWVEKGQFGLIGSNPR
jgi:tetratricopeptide (TPR) repeat protein